MPVSWELAGKCPLLTVFLRSCKNILKFSAVVKWLGFKLVRDITFQQDILEQTTVCFLQGPAELRAVARHLSNGLHGWSDLSFQLDSLYGRLGHWQVMRQPCNRSPHSHSSTLCSPCIQQSCSNILEFVTEATSAAASCYTVKNFAHFSCSSSLVLKGCCFAAELRLGGDAVGTQSLSATLNFADGCSSWSCCAKHFLSSHPDSCVPVSFPLMSEKCPVTGSAVLVVIHGLHTWVAASVPRALLSAVKAWVLGCDCPSKSACGALGTSMLVVPKPLLLVLFPLLPGKASMCREWGSGHPLRRQKKTDWHFQDLLGVQKARRLPRRDQAHCSLCPETRRYWDAPWGGTGCVLIPAGGTGIDFVPSLLQKSMKCFGAQGILKVLLLGCPQSRGSLARSLVLLQVVASHRQYP